MEISKGGDPTQGQQKVQINIAEQPDIKCENCDGIYFEPSVRFKRISKLLTGSPEDQIAPVEVYRCVDCGTPNTSLLPKELQ